MDTQLITIYCLSDDLLRALDHREDPQRKMSDAEVMTTALAAARLFKGNFAAARGFLESHGYIPQMLSKGAFSARLHRLVEPLWLLFQVLAETFKTRESAQGRALYLMDSFPIAVCDNEDRYGPRIRRSRLYPSQETADAYRGYIASKRRFFYGLKVHMLVTPEGLPVEVFLTPGSASDTAELKNFAFDLPEGATIYGDKAYNEYLTEDLLHEACQITLLPVRKKNSRRKLETYVEYVQRCYRKRVETAGSLIERLLPKSIHATSARGFELKVFLFVLAHSLSGVL